MAMQRAPLWIVRHARPLIADGVCYGASDVPAEPQSTRQCAQSLAVVLPEGTRVLSSPRRRCTALADALVQERPDLSWRADDRLAEMDFGCWEGRPWSDIPKAAIDQWTAQFGHWKFGGRESVDDLMARVGAAWRQTVGSGAPTLWISHAGVARAASLHAGGAASVRFATDWPVEGLGFGAWVRF